MLKYFWQILPSGKEIVLNLDGEETIFTLKELEAKIKAIKSRQNLYLDDQSWKDIINMYEHGIQLLSR